MQFYETLKVTRPPSIRPEPHMERVVVTSKVKNTVLARPDNRNRVEFNERERFISKVGATREVRGGKEGLGVIVIRRGGQLIRPKCGLT